MRIEACFDSHVHWAATGEFSSRLRLDELRSPQEIAALKVLPQHQRGDWLLGFGWNDNAWTEKPTREVLDRIFPGKAVAFTRCDAHALWVSTEALKRAGLWIKSPAPIAGGRIDLGADGFPSGVLLDQAMGPIEKVVPSLSNLEMRRCLLKAVKTFNDAGFTHIRDMTCNEMQWNEAVRLDESGLLTLAVEEFFWVRDLSEFPAALELAMRARDVRSPNLRSKGLKIFLDGALGSEGAWLSRCYHGGERHSGLQLWGTRDLSEVLIKSWEVEMEVAVHTIGDAAAELLVKTAAELKAQGRVGKFHMEHAELLRPETVSQMRELSVECHLQPSHWLSDRAWLKEKIGDLYEHAFPWRRLQEAEIPFYFGSDAPIEPASLPRTFQALRESAEAGIPRLLGGPANYMSHRDLSWAPNSFTLLEGESLQQVVFRGEHLT